MAIQYERLMQPCKLSPNVLCMIVHSAELLLNPYWRWNQWIVSKNMMYFWKTLHAHCIQVWKKAMSNSTIPLRLGISDLLMPQFSNNISISWQRTSGFRELQCPKVYAENEKEDREEGKIKLIFLIAFTGTIRHVVSLSTHKSPRREYPFPFEYPENEKAGRMTETSITQGQEITLTKPISLAFSLKHWRQTFNPYLRIKPALWAQTRL